MVTVSAVTKDKIYTEGSAFSIGVLNGIIARRNPSTALLTTVITAVGGLALSLMTRGALADVGEGFAAGSLGSLGYSIPFWFANEPAGSVAVRGVKQIKALNSPKALGAGNGTSAMYAQEFENVEMYP